MVEDHVEHSEVIPRISGHFRKGGSSQQDQGDKHIF